MAKNENLIKDSDITDITFEKMIPYEAESKYECYFDAKLKDKPIKINCTWAVTGLDTHTFQTRISDDDVNYSEPNWKTLTDADNLMHRIEGKLNMQFAILDIEISPTVSELSKSESDIIKRLARVSEADAEQVWRRYRQRMDALVASEYKPVSISIPIYNDLNEQGFASIQDMHMPAFWIIVDRNDGDSDLYVMKKGVADVSHGENYICPVLHVDDSIEARSSFLFKGKWWTTVQPGIAICEDGIGYSRAEVDGRTIQDMLSDWAKENMPEINVVPLLNEAPIRLSILPDITGVAPLTAEEAAEAAYNVPGILSLAGEDFWTRDEDPRGFARAYCMCKVPSGGTGMMCAQCDMDMEAGVRPALRIANMNELGLFPGDKIKYQGYTWTAISSKQLLCDSIVAQSKYLDVRFDENKREFVKSDGTTVPESSLTYRFSDLAAAIDDFVKDAQIPIVPAAPPEMEHMPVYDDDAEIG